MEFRQAHSSEITELARLRLAFLDENHGGLADAQRARLRPLLITYFDAHLGRDLLAFVADDAGELVSTVMLLLSDRPANLHYPTGRLGTLLNVYTRPDCRRRGYAEKLVRMALEAARAAGAASVELLATKQGQPLYERIGFLPEEQCHTPMRLEL